MLMLSWRQRRTVCRQTHGSCLKTMAWWDAIQPEAMNCQSMQKIDSTGYVRLLWESIGKATEFSYASIFEVKIEKKPERAFADLREKTVDTLLSDLGTVALVIEGSDLGMIEDNSVPSARCIQDTKKRELVTRSNLQRLRCSVCHLHHEQALRAPHRVRQVFAQALKKVQHHRVDVVVGDATAAAYRYYKRQEYQALYNSSICRHVKRKFNENSTWTAHFRADIIVIIRPIITILSIARQIILIVASWLFPHGEDRLDQNCEKTLEQHVWAYTEWTKGASWGQLLSKGYWSLT